MDHKFRSPAALALSIAIMGATLSATPAVSQDTMESIKAGAEEEGAILWVDAYTQDVGQALLDAFQEAYPFIEDAQYVQVSGPQKHSRTIQECSAGVDTTDFYVANPANQQELVDKGFVESVDWQALGVSEDLVASPEMVAAATVVFVLLYNTNNVSGDDVPAGWEDMIDPKWQGRTGKYGRAGELQNIAAVWGEDRALEYAKSYAVLEPRLYPNTFAVAQAVASGELDVAFGVYDSAIRVKNVGAPIELKPIDPVPLTLLYGSVISCGAHPNAAKLFLTWITSAEGALAYEAATERGNAFVPSTHSAQMIEGMTHSYFPADYQIKNAQEFQDFAGEIESMLQGQ